MEPKETQENESPFSARVFRTLLQLARDYKAQFVIIALFAFLATGADLLQPLIYKRAINDVAGLFVGDSATATALGVQARSARETLTTLMVSVVRKLRR